MLRALDIVREVALLETYALPLERADESGTCRASFQSRQRESLGRSHAKRSPDEVRRAG